ncbi:MAG: glycosyltransferase family 39 protein [Phycisphaerae bacterium]|nr:glycosyltransferase family 39 protein [Phycisphaerae bacterium]
MNRVFRPKYKYQLLMILIFILGFALRLYHIDFLDIWRDESFSIKVASQPLHMILDITINDMHPPLHLFLLKFWMNVFGKSAISVRMLSLTFGMLTIYLTYLLSTLVFSKPTYRLLTALFASINPLLIVYSQETRGYSMLTTFATAAIYFACRMNSKARLNTYFYFILFSILGLYTHNIFPMVLAGIMIATLIGILYPDSHRIKLSLFFRHGDFKRAAVSCVCISLCYLPWLAVIVQQYAKMESEGFWLQFDPFKNVIFTYGQFFTSESYNSSLTALNRFAYRFIRLFAIWLSIGGIILEFGSSTRYSPKLSWLVLLMLGIIYLISFKTPLYHVRYLIFVVPILLTIISYGVRDVLAFIGRKTAIVLTALFIISNLVFYLTNIAQTTYKAEYQKAIRSIEFEPATDIILHPHACSYHSFNYYSNLPNYIYDPNRNIAYFEGLAYLSDEDYYDGNLAKYTRIWTLHLWKDEGFEKKLNTQGFVEVEAEQFGNGLFVKLFARKQMKSTPQNKIITPAIR